MAIVKPTINGNPVLEANLLHARHTGRIWSNYELDSTDFATDEAYNGMLLAINDVKKTVEYPASTTTEQAKEVYGLLFSSEAEYDHKGLNTFALAREINQAEPNVSVQLPRLYELKVGDILTSNCVVLDGTHIASLDSTTTPATALNTLLSDTSSTAVYGGINSATTSANGAGFIYLDTAIPAYGPVLQATDYTTLPNGDWAVRFVVRKA